MLSTRDPPQNKGHIQTESEGLEKDIIITNVYAPNIGAPQYVRQMLTSMKGEINNNTIIVGDFIYIFIFRPCHVACGI